MKIRKFILLPFALLYGLLIRLRNLLYDYGVLKTHEFDIPVICIGNLSTGGTGKTPHIEYVVKLLHQKGYKPAVLTRGYGRKTKGFIEVKRSHTAKEVGDEPCQIKRKFPGLIIGVTGRRVFGIKKLLEKHPNLDAILLDDGFQHRSVKPGLNILLTEYTDPFTQQSLLPAGKLREPISERKRADIIVVTKCPNVYSPIEFRRMTDSLKPYSHQELYLSYLAYKSPVKFDRNTDKPEKKELSEELKVLLFTGIANPIPLKNQVMRYCRELKSVHFPDHHFYTEKDLKKIQKEMESIPPANRMVLTTEKDVYRIAGSKLEEKFAQLPLYYLPVKVGVHQAPEQNTFDSKILDYVQKNRRNHEIPEGKSKAEQ